MLVCPLSLYKNLKVYELSTVGQLHTHTHTHTHTAMCVTHLCPQSTTTMLLTTPLVWWTLNAAQRTVKQGITGILQAHSHEEQWYLAL
jgi:hypothetical protein